MWSKSVLKYFKSYRLTSQSSEAHSKFGILSRYSILINYKWNFQLIHTSQFLSDKEDDIIKKIKGSSMVENQSENQLTEGFHPHENPQQDFMDPYPDKMRYRKKYSNPIERACGIFKDDILEFFGRLKYNPVVSIHSNNKIRQFSEMREIFPEHCDVAIIGGGLVGVSIAYHLQERAKEGLRIVVIEKDLSYKKASSVLSVGGIRQQFSTPENIVLSKYGMDFLQTAPSLLSLEGQDVPDFGVNYHGYLTLASEKGMVQLIENYNLQKEYGSYVKLLSKKQLQEKYLWLNTDDIDGGVVGTQREGWFDPWSLLLAMAKKTKELGTHYVQGEVSIGNLEELGDLVNDEDKPASMKRVRNLTVNLPDGEQRQINCSLCIIAAGAWSQEVGLRLGVGTALTGMRSVPIPVEPRKRYVYCVKCADGPGLSTPLVVDTDGTYFRREGLADLYLCGKSPEEGEEPSNEDLSVDHSFFEETVWPNVAKRCPAFNNLKLHSSWAGYYDYNTFDQNAIIGRHPLYSNLFMATGFSGHGVQQAAGAGKAISELVLDAEYKSLNLERLGFERIILNEPILEKCVY